MAASFKPKTPAPADAPKAPQFRAIEALPQLMPAALDQANQDGWKLITIVAMRDSNDHVAYFQRD